MMVSIPSLSSSFEHNEPCIVRMLKVVDQIHLPCSRVWCWVSLAVLTTLDNNLGSARLDNTIFSLIAVSTNIG